MIQVYSIEIKTGSAGNLGHRLARMIGGDDFLVRQKIERLYSLVRDLPSGPMQRMYQPSCLGKWVLVACDDRSPVAMVEVRMTEWFGEIWLRLDNLVVHPNYNSMSVEEFLIEAVKVKAQTPLPRFAKSLLVTHLQAVVNIRQVRLQPVFEQCGFNLIDRAHDEFMYDYDLVGK